MIRRGKAEDGERLARLRNALWPENSVEEHRREVDLLLAGKSPGIMPMVVFVAEESGELVGFVEVGLRSCADGCDLARAVGYVEGWYVEAQWRRRGIGAELVRAAEEWARGQGCVEMASDTQITNEISQRAHAALGFEVAERSVLYRKKL
ncbi:MAG TPA: GNAT family N-acetyltransferase [Candidatus Acidoferrum sp.]